MNTLQKGISTLLRCAITGQSHPLPEDFQLEAAMPLIREHGIVTLAYEGAVCCGMDRKLPVMRELFQSYGPMMLQSERQVRELARLFAAFQKSEIDFLPVKGCRMKALYPRPELRLMGDADILIRREQYTRKIRPCLEELGFEYVNESDHEIVWKSRGLYLELHKCLIPSYQKKWHRYFGDGWQLAVQETGTQFTLSEENAFLFYLTHFARHFQLGGIGCRHVVDLWVFQRCHPDMDKQRLAAELSGLGLQEFYENLQRLFQAWFEDGPADRQTEAMSAYIFSSGSWGDEGTKTVSMALQNAKGSSQAARGKLGYLLPLFFPNFRRMRKKYPVLEKAPWLLPLLWVYRLVHKLLFEWNAVTKYYKKRLDLISPENLETRSRFLQFVGLEETFD